MNCKIGDFLKNMLMFSKNKPGEIRFKVNVTNFDCITFRVDAKTAIVDWGDRDISAEIKNTKKFQHIYQHAGVYEIFISGKGIINLEIKNCHITTLEVDKCPTIEFIDCSENFLTGLDVRKCTRLFELYCGKNQLRELKLEKYKKLFYLSCSCNNLESINVDGCKELSTLRCRQNNIQTLDVSHCPKLAFVNIEGNRFDYDNLIEFFSTLVTRPLNDVGLVVFYDNIDFKNYDNSKIRDLLKPKGWREI